MPPNALPPEEVAIGLENLRRSAEVILSFGHFITRDMKAELDRTAFRGVLPLIYMFIAMTGGEIVSTRYIAVVGGGAVQGAGQWVCSVEGAAARGSCRISRPRPQRRADHDYVQANVADDFLKSNGSLLQWAGSHGPGNVYLKAASDPLHETYFSRIRSFLLNYATSVLQDDSGIPLRFFRDGRWQLWLFGTYSGTLDIFAKYYQSDLQSAFATSGAAAPLPFGTGYKWRVGESNLMLAIKQKGASTSKRACPALGIRQASGKIACRKSGSRKPALVPRRTVTVPSKMTHRPADRESRPWQSCQQVRFRDRQCASNRDA